MAQPSFRKQTSAARLTAWQWSVAVALLLALFFQMARGALRNSVTFDEGQHISRGYVYLKTGDLRFQHFRSAHPPGMEIMEAAPLLLLPDAPEPATLYGWAETDIVIFAKQLVLKSPNIEKLMFAARVPVMLVTLLLAAFVFRWASDLAAILHKNARDSGSDPAYRAGIKAGLLALGVCAFEPNLIAHGMLATNDMGVAASCFIALYWLWKSLRRPSPGALVAAGIALGAALVTKMTALLLLPVSALLILAMGLANRRADYFARVQFIDRITARVQRSYLRRLLGLIVMGAVMYAIGFLVVWALYRFEVGTLPGFPIPVPAATHFSSIVKAQGHLDVGHPAFLMGQISTEGWWYYFPVAFLIKTPLPLLILLLVAAIRFIVKERRRVTTLPLVAFTCAYALVALFSAVNIGYRHLLPILPFLFVFVGTQISNTQYPIPSPSTMLPGLAARAGRTSLKSRYAAYILRFTFYILLLWYVTGALSIFPNYLTFFNELVGGPQNGYKYLVDSNLDWGQSLVELRDYAARHKIDSINLSTTGYVNPAVYGIAYKPLPPMPKPQNIVRFDPAPGRYYIGAHNLQIGSPIDHDIFGWFRERAPDEWIANAILVYDVAPRPAGQWVAQCTTPQTPLDPENIDREFRREDLRLIYFDCQTSWIYPSNVPGWYILSQAARPAMLPKSLTLEFRTGGLSNETPLTLYRLDAQPDLPPLSTQVSIPSGDAPTPEMSLQAPVDAGPLAFLGFTLDRAQVRPGQTVVLTTCWQVRSGIGRLVSLMAHVVTADGQVIANGDGLGVPAENWQAGDVIVQRHVLTIPTDTPPGTYQTQTGLYAFDDSSRFDVTSNGKRWGNRLLLAPIEVK